MCGKQNCRNLTTVPSIDCLALYCTTTTPHSKQTWWIKRRD